MTDQDGSKTSYARQPQKEIRLALIALNLKVARRSSDTQLDIEGRIELYLRELSSWPMETALACLEEHAKRSIYWPAWKELEDLRAEREGVSADRDEVKLLPVAGALTNECLSERLNRIDPINGIKRMSRLKPDKLRELMRQHRRMADPDVVKVFERLERGMPWPSQSAADAPFERREHWDGLTEALSKLRDPDVPMLARENLLKVGTRIEARQGEYAQRMGWAP